MVGGRPWAYVSLTAGELVLKFNSIESPMFTRGVLIPTRVYPVTYGYIKVWKLTWACLLGGYTEDENSRISYDRRGQKWQTQAIQILKVVDGYDARLLWSSNFQTHIQEASRTGRLLCIFEIFLETASSLIVNLANVLFMAFTALRRVPRQPLLKRGIIRLTERTPLQVKSQWRRKAGHQLARLKK